MDSRSLLGVGALPFLLLSIGAMVNTDLGTATVALMVGALLLLKSVQVKPRLRASVLTPLFRLPVFFLALAGAALATVVYLLPLPGPQAGGAHPRVRVRHPSTGQGPQSALGRIAHGSGHVGSTVIHGVSALPSRLIGEIGKTTIWQSMTFGLLLLGIAAGLGIAALVWTWRRRVAGKQGSRIRTGVSTLAIAFTAILGVAVGVNSYAGYVPSLRSLVLGVTASPLRFHLVRIPGYNKFSPDVRSINVLRARTPVASRMALYPVLPRVGHSRIVELSVAAPWLRIVGRPVYVYLPPNYSEAARRVRYPVVYMIHGFPGSAQDWLQAGGLQQTMDTMIGQHLIRPMVVVMPEASNYWLDDSECLNLPGSEQDMTYLARVVVKVVDAMFNTQATRSGRAIGGMSSGGYCALNVGLHNQDVFSTILASQPFGDPGQALIGPVGGLSAWLANSPRADIPTMRFRRHLSIFLDAGTGDTESARVARILARELAGRGQYVALRIVANQTHTWREARLELPYSLMFANRHLTSKRLRAGSSPTGLE